MDAPAILRHIVYHWAEAWRVDSIRLIASWLDYCLKNHGPTCPGVLGRGASLPTRLLDVQPRDDSELRLVETEHNPPSDTRYLALSHCWGRYQPLHNIKTMTQTLEASLSTIPFQKLPATFQDAIKITRELGLRYLWIDSLCIIQDSEQDWEREASLMGSVYKNAYCTIAATASPDGSGGCFVPRSSALLQAGFESSFPRPDVPPSMIPRPPPVWKKMIESGALGSRAWCFQERQLSPRVVHFTSHGLMWECCTCVATEENPESGLQPIDWCDDLTLDKSYDLGMGYNLHRIFETGDPRRLAVLGERRSHVELLYDRWIDGIANYTRRELSRSSDRFPALSGLAQVFKDETGDTYLAGLWRGDLCRGLLWYRSYLDSAPERARHWTRPTEHEYLAPSWSWASINGPVNAMHFLRVNPLRHAQNLSQFQLLDYNIITTGANPTGRISAAKLKVSGLLKRARSGQPAKNSHFWYLHEHDVIFPGSDIYPTIGRITFDIPTESLSQPVYCLNVVDYGMVRWSYLAAERVINGEVMPEFVPQNGGLALVPINEAADEFRRIGVVEWQEGWFDGCQPVAIDLV